ncbi:PIF1 helicase-like protein [Novymonas esmeraldas]|uniref:ATP-dependent DNA helicase n=1 Tax=Novymonas esmeraldas TaxID=1808958 RepID=A0AAW0F298_9TRYP
MWRHVAASPLARRHAAVQLISVHHPRTASLHSLSTSVRIPALLRGGGGSSGGSSAAVGASLTPVRWQSTSDASSRAPAAPPGAVKRRGRPPGRKGRRTAAADASAAEASASTVASPTTTSTTSSSTTAAAVAAAAPPQVLVRAADPMPLPPPAEGAALTAKIVEPLAVEAGAGVEAASAAASQQASPAAEPVAVTAASEAQPQQQQQQQQQPNAAAEVVERPKRAASRARKASPPSSTAASAAAVAPASPTQPVVDLFRDNLDEESFFASLLIQSGGETPTATATAASGHADLRESTLVYNALTGRMTSEVSQTMMCMRELGFGVNSQRQVNVEKPDVLNALAARVRAGTVALPAKWPVTLSRVLGSVLLNKNIDDPAKALQQMIQVKTNSVMRSRYASVVSAVGSEVDAAMAGTPATHGLLGGTDDAELAIELNEEQKRVIDIALRGHHMYVGGSAGTGKTVLLRALARRLQGHRLRVAMTATTGVAGCHIGGSTFHHALGVTSRGEFMRRSAILDYDVIIIDEVSMFPQSLFEEFDRVLREEAGTPDLPFGGVQIILCGDFLQLGCINEKSLIGSALFLKNFVKVRLETQVRQTPHSKFAGDLQLMRLGIVPTDLKTTVQQLPPGTMVDSAVNLLPTNKEVHAANERELLRLTGDPLTLTPETGITSLQCETTATLLLRTTPTFNEAEFARHVRSLLQATLDLPRASLLSLYRVYEDGHAMRVMLPPGESLAWRDAMRERFLEIASLLNDLELGATVTEIVPNGDGLHTSETEEYLLKVMAKHPIAQPLTLKQGCRVLLRSNLSSNLVNGSIGTVVDFVECKEESFPEYIKTDAVKRCIDRYRVFCFTECGMPVPMVPVVKFYSGETIAIPPWEFSVGGGPNTQFYSLSSVALPLSLAYAFTVHKVQGLTLVGRVHLELSRMWPCEHLLYVAMSRVRNPEQLSMSSFNASMVVANETCVHFDKTLRGALQWTVGDVAKFPVSAWKRCNDTVYHLRRRGASLRRLLEGVTSMNGAAPALVTSRGGNGGGGGISSSSASEDMNHSRQSHALGEDDHDAHGEHEMSSTSDGSSRVMVRVGRHGGGGGEAAGIGDSAALSLEHLGAIQQSVLVARRMRKLVRHVERVAKLTDARRRIKGAAKGRSTPTGHADASADSSDSTPQGFTTAATSDGDSSLEMEKAATVMAAASVAAAVVAAKPSVSLVMGEEHTF